MQKPIYVHYGSTFFEPSRNFPIRIIEIGASLLVDYGRLARMRLLDGRTGANGRSLENAMRIILLNFSYVIIQKLPLFIV